MIKAILIILAVALYMAIVTQFAWYVGKFIHFGMDDEKEVEQHDDDK